MYACSILAVALAGCLERSPLRHGQNVDLGVGVQRKKKCRVAEDRFFFFSNLWRVPRSPRRLRTSHLLLKRNFSQRGRRRVWMQNLFVCAVVDVTQGSLGGATRPGTHGTSRDMPLLHVWSLRCHYKKRARYFCRDVAIFFFPGVWWYPSRNFTATPGAMPFNDDNRWSCTTTSQSLSDQLMEQIAVYGSSREFALRKLKLMRVSRPTVSRINQRKISCRC